MPEFAELIPHELWKWVRIWPGITIITIIVILRVSVIITIITLKHLKP
jgi:hypothetical protein